MTGFHDSDGPKRPSGYAALAETIITVEFQLVTGVLTILQFMNPRVKRAQ